MSLNERYEILACGAPRKAHRRSVHGTKVLPASWSSPASCQCPGSRFLAWWSGWPGLSCPGPCLGQSLRAQAVMSVTCANVKFLHDLHGMSLLARCIIEPLGEQGSSNGDRLQQSNAGQASDENTRQHLLRATCTWHHGSSNTVGFSKAAWCVPLMRKLLGCWAASAVCTVGQDQTSTSRR